jgi:hypothetical protein
MLEMQIPNQHIVVNVAELKTIFLNSKEADIPIFYGDHKKTQ